MHLHGSAVPVQDTPVKSGEYHSFIEAFENDGQCSVGGLQRLFSGKIKRLRMLARSTVFL